MHFQSSRLLIWAAGLAYGVYLVFRAYNVPLVFDEATTFFLYIQTNEVWPGTGFWSANHHYLSTLLTWLSVKVFGLSAFSLRLHSLLAYAVFWYFLMAFAQRMPKVWMQLLLVVSFLGGTYAMEFFAYSRGYSLAWAFWLGAWWCLFRLDEKPTIKVALGFAAQIFLMVAANLSVLPGAGLLVLLALRLVFLRQRQWLWWLAPALLLPLLGGAVVTKILADAGELYYGGRDGFVATTLGSLGQAYFNQGVVGKILLGLLFLMGLFGAFRQWVHQDWRAFPKFTTWPVWVAFGCVVFYQVAHFLFDVLFPLDRAAVYLVWALVLGVFLMTAEMYDAHKKLYLPLVGLVMGFVVMGLLVLRPHSSANPIWRGEQIPQAFYATVAADTGATIGGSYILEPQWQWMQLQNAAPMPLFVVGNSRLLDYKLVPFSASGKHPEYQIAKQFEQSLILMQRKEPVVKAIIRDSLLPTGSFSGDYGFLSLALPSDGFPDVLEIQLTLGPNTRVFPSAVVIQTLDTSGALVHYQDVKWHRNFDPLQTGITLKLWLDLTGIPQKQGVMHVYLYNPNGFAFEVASGRVVAWREGILE